MLVFELLSNLVGRILLAPHAKAAARLLPVLLLLLLEA